MRIQSLYDVHLSFPDVDGFWNTQDLPETEKRIRALLPYGESAATLSQIEALTQAVRLFTLQKKFKEAKDFLVYANTLLKELPSSETAKLQIRYFLEEGRFYCLTMCPTKALESFRQAWEISRSQTNLEYLAIDSAYMISVTLPAKQGKEWFKIAMEMSENSEDNSLASKWRTYLHLRAGWLAFDMYDYVTSLKLFEKAQAEVGSENLFLIRTILWSRGRVLRALGQIEEAKKIQQNIYMENASNGDANGHVCLELAECCKAMKKTEEAAMYFELAYEKLKSNTWYSENFANELTEMHKKFKTKKSH